MPNRFQVKRTTTSGLLPNVTNSSNTTYIAAGELAINLTDKKLLSSNGSATFEIGANLASISVGGALTGNSTGLYHTGTINAASFTVGATVVANSTAVFATRLNSKTEGNLNVNNAVTSGAVTVTDTRAAQTTPETVASPLVDFDFKQNTTEGLSDGGTYFGEMTFRPYGSTTDWSGGPSHQLGFTSNNNVYHRSGNSTTWGAWARLYKEGTVLAAGNTTITGFANVTTTATVGTGFTLTSGNANFDSGVLFVDGANDRVGIGTASPVVRLDVAGGEARIANDIGGTYGGQLKLVNSASGATNTDKSFRIGPTGNLEIINSAYNAVPFTFTDAGILSVSAECNAPVFKDVNNSAYYLDPGSTSNLNGLTVASTITGSITGNAGTATTLQTARTINGVSFNGSANITITANTTNTLTRGTYLTGDNFNGSAATTWAVDATTTATASKIVARNSSGDDFRRYGFAEYFNMSHGASGATTDTVFYSSGDDYIRKNNATGFRASLNVPTRTGGDASGTWDITANYCRNLTQGFNTNWNTDFSDAPVGGTILRGDTSTGSATGGPGGTWWFQQNMRHGNGTNLWGVQVAWGWEDNTNRLRTRNVTSGTYGSWVEYLSTAGHTYNGNLTLTGSIISSASDVRAPIFYDNDNTAYYVNPLGTSNLLGNVYIARDGASNDTFGGLEVRENTYAGAGDGEAQDAPGINFHWSMRAAARIYMNGSGHFVLAGQSDITNNRRQLYLSDLIATGNVTAYFSDERLKTKIGDIPNAVNIIQSLNGFRYVNNDTAKEHGYESDAVQIGLSAQEVQAVLPEIVELAGFDIDINSVEKKSKTGENYLTVDYSKIVPVLIEAIKEQQEQINRLEVKINSLQQGN